MTHSKLHHIGTLPGSDISIAFLYLTVAGMALGLSSADATTGLESDKKHNQHRYDHHDDGHLHALRSPPIFEPRDSHTLRHVLDCGDSCVYAGSESIREDSLASEDKTPEIHQIISGGSAVSVQKLSRKMHCPTSWFRLLSSCPASEWPPPKNVPDALRSDFTMGGRAAVSDWYFTNRYSGGDALLPHWLATDLDARIAATY